MIPNRDLRDLVHLARAHAVSPNDALVLAGQMLAVAALSSEEGEANPILGADEELTSQGWNAYLAVAEQLWRKRVELSPEVRGRASPFHEAKRAQLARPGFFELVRQAVSARVRQERLLDDREAMVEACLELASELSATPADFSAPPILAELMVNLADLQPEDRVYCAFAGAAGAALRAARAGSQTVLEVPDQETAAFWSSLAVASRVPMSVAFSDPLEGLLTDWFAAPRAEFDVSIVAPPFGKLPMSKRIPGSGGPPQTREGAGVALAVRKARRLAVCWLPAGFLFRTTALEAQFKERAISKYGLAAVVGLPPGPVAGGSSIASSLLLFQPEAAVGGVLMLDHSRGKPGRRNLDQDDVEQIARLVRQRQDGDSSRIVGVDELAANQFNIAPDRYVLTDEEARLQRLLSESQSAVLEELVDIYRPQPTPGTFDPSNPELREADAPRELSVSDLDEVGLARRPLKILDIAPTEYFKLRKAELRPGDVLLVTKGSVGRVGYVRDLPANEYWVANQSFAVLRLRRNAAIKDSRVLFRFLSSGVGQSLILRLRTGTVIPSLPMGDIKRLQVLVPSPQGQHEVANEVEALFSLQAELNQKRRLLAERQRTIWPDAPMETGH